MERIFYDDRSVIHPASFPDMRGRSEMGMIAATPMVDWGSSMSNRYVRVVFSNEPDERPRGIGQKSREASK